MYLNLGRQWVDKVEDLEVLKVLKDSILVGINWGSGVNSSIGRLGGGSVLEVSTIITLLP